MGMTFRLVILVKSSTQYKQNSRIEMVGVYDFMVHGQTSASGFFAWYMYIIE